MLNIVVTVLILTPIAFRHYADKWSRHINFCVVGPDFIADLHYQRALCVSMRPRKSKAVIDLSYVIISVNSDGWFDFSTGVREYLLERYIRQKFPTMEVFYWTYKINGDNRKRRSRNVC